jgi:hypothetical protein
MERSRHGPTVARSMLQLAPSTVRQKASDGSLDGRAPTSERAQSAGDPVGTTWDRPQPCKKVAAE